MKAKRTKAKRPTKRSSDTQKPLRDHLLAMLRGGHAHSVLGDILSDWPESARGVKPPGQPFTGWRVLEHLRISQWDILEFSKDPKHVSPTFPEGYWPRGDVPPSAAAWEASVAQAKRDLLGMERLVADPTTDLYAPIPHGDGQTILREALVLASHNSYHLGQLVLLRRLLGVWPS